MRDHERHGGHAEKEVRIAFLHALHQPLALGIPENRQAGLVPLAHVVHLPRAARVEKEELAVGYPKAAIRATANRVRHRTIRHGGWVHANVIRIDHLDNFIDLRVRVAELVRVVLHVVHARVHRSPVDVEVEHFIQWQLGEISLGIGQHIAVLFHRGLAVMHRMIMGEGIGPAEVIHPGLGADVAKHRPAVPATRRARTPDVVHQFVIIEGEHRRHLAMPLGEIGAAVEVEFVVLPDAHNRRHVLNHLRHRIGRHALILGPHGGRGLSQLFVEPVAVHDAEVHLSSLLLQQRRIRREADPDAVLGTLIRTRRELKGEVEQAAWIQFLVLQFLAVRQCLEGSLNARGEPINVGPHDVLRVRLQALQSGPSRIVVTRLCGDRLRDAIHRFRLGAVTKLKRPWLLRSRPDLDRVIRHLAKDRSMSDQIVLRVNGKREGKEKRDS